MEIITQTNPGPQTDFEGDYIYNYLLKDINSYDTNHRVIVYSSNRREKLPKDVQQGDVVVHLSNENLRYNYNFLPGRNVVLRSYYHPFIFSRKCYAIPLGWQTGFANSCGKIGEHNKYMWCFIGQIKGYRKPMYEAFKDTEPGFASVSQQWNSRSLSDADVQQVYLDSAFGLVPFGSIHADTMRIMEVMEWGCIPIVVKYLKDDYYKYIFGDHPFIIGENWEDAKEKVLRLWNDKERLRKKQEEVANWYKRYKLNLKDDIDDILRGGKPTRCSQWKYQKYGHWNPWVLLTWYYHFYFKKQPIY